MADFEIIVYATSQGKIPFKEWVNSLKDVKGQQIILARLE
jgi:putative component of toxin-antitoxin plasmid stabilization module